MNVRGCEVSYDPSEAMVVWVIIWSNSSCPLLVHVVFLVGCSRVGWMSFEVCASLLVPLWGQSWSTSIVHKDGIL